MAKIEDITKLAPELLNKSSAQLEREITERQMALAEIKAREAEAKRASLLNEAGERIDRIITDLKWANENGFLSANLTEKFIGKDKFGKPYFAPHLSLKRPK